MAGGPRRRWGDTQALGHQGGLSLSKVGRYDKTFCPLSWETCRYDQTEERDAEGLRGADDSARPPGRTSSCRPLGRSPFSMGLLPPLGRSNRAPL